MYFFLHYKSGKGGGNSLSGCDFSRKACCKAILGRGLAFRRIFTSGGIFESFMTCDLCCSGKNITVRGQNFHDYIHFFFFFESVIHDPRASSFSAPRSQKRVVTKSWRHSPLVANWHPHGLSAGRATGCLSSVIGRRRPLTWVVPGQSGGGAKHLPQEWWIFLFVFPEDVLQGPCPVELI